MSQAHFIVFANEKGGTGKSTTAVHVAVALAASGHRVGALDLDGRQRTMTRYLENRDATMRRLEQDDLPRAAYEVLEDHSEFGLFRSDRAAVGRGRRNRRSTRPAATTRLPGRRSSGPIPWSRR